MPHGKSREAGRAGLLQKELTQHWERPSCNKALKACAQQQNTKAPSLGPPQPHAAHPGTHCQLPHTWAPTSLSPHTWATTSLPGVPQCPVFPSPFELNVTPAPFSALFPPVSPLQSHFCCNFHTTSPSLPTACPQDCLTMILPFFGLPSFRCSLKNLPTPLVFPPPHSSPLARLCSSPATIPPVQDDILH